MGKTLKLSEIIKEISKEKPRLIEEKDLEYIVGEDFDKPTKMLHAFAYTVNGKCYRVDKYLPKGVGLSKMDKDPMVALLLDTVNDG